MDPDIRIEVRSLTLSAYYWRRYVYRFISFNIPHVTALGLREWRK
jgi:hypothetical protein